MSKSIDTIKSEIAHQELVKQRAYSKIAELKEEAIQLAPFRVGSKVIVTKSTGMGTTKEVICYIGSIKFKEWKKADWFEYTFNKVKKDGTMSGQFAGIYSYKDIRLENPLLD